MKTEAWSLNQAAKCFCMQSKPQQSNAFENWPRLGWRPWIPILVALVLVGVVTWSRLPRGICFGDAGDLQLASATLGIAHPPGYPILVSLGFLLTLIPGLDPPWGVTLGCWASVLATLGLAILFQIRLGVPAYLAAASALIWSAQYRIWQNLLGPEVYGPSLALFAGSVYLLFKYTRTTRRVDLLLAALLLGMISATRPATAIAWPFIVAAYFLAKKVPSLRKVQQVKGLLLAGTCTAIPFGYAFGFLYLQDAPGAAYNYIEQHNQTWQALPEADAGVSAKIERVVWQASGAQFRHLMGSDWSSLRSKFRWLRGQLDLDWMPIMISAFVLVLLALLLTWRRSTAAACLLAGMIVQPLVFIGMYRVHGAAADLLPLLWACMVLSGVLIAAVWPFREGANRTAVSMVLFVGLAIWTLFDAPGRSNAGLEPDATAFVSAVDLATLPADAMICAQWATAVPLWYVQEEVARRDDLRIVADSVKRIPDLLAECGDCPVFLTTKPPKLPAGLEAEAFRNLWQIVSAENDSGPPMQEIGR